MAKGEKGAATRGRPAKATDVADTKAAASSHAIVEQAVRRHQNRAVEAAQVIEELIALAKEMRAAQARGEALGLNTDELAFYDALEVDDSAVKVLGDNTLRDIARELVENVRKNATIDWTVKESRPREAPRHREAHPTQMRLPARQAGSRHEHSPPAGRAAVGLVERMNSPTA